MSILVKTEGPVVIVGRLVFLSTAGNSSPIRQGRMYVVGDATNQDEPVRRSLIVSAPAQSPSDMGFVFESVDAAMRWLNEAEAAEWLDYVGHDYSIVHLALDVVQAP